MKVKRWRLIFNGLFVITLLLLSALIVILVLTLVYAFSDNTDFSGLNLLGNLCTLFFVCILMACAVSLAAIVKIAVFFNASIDNLLDPETARIVYSEHLKLFAQRRSSQGFHILMSRILDLEGEYEKALEEFLPKKEGRIIRFYRYRLAYLYLRCGRLEDARPILERLEKESKKGAGISAAQIHVLGLYCLESGESEKARQYFAVSSYNESALYKNKRISKLYCEYDLACLEEKEGNPNKALEHYKQAAAIGAKTWMGQEAARRAEALSSDTV